jgi:hypothetical protein
MKKNQLTLSFLLIAQLLLVTPRLMAQGPVTTGTVVSVTKEAGTIIVNSTQTGKPITMYGLEKAAVMNPTGTALTLADVKPGALVSVHYQPRGDRWFVSRIVVPEKAPAVPNATPSLTVPEVAAAKSKAANDGDITTQPGTKARIDGDRTTQPGKKDPADPDITKRPDNK